MPHFESGVASVQKARPYTTTSTRKCQYCSKELNAKGHKSHEKACGTLTRNAKRDREYELQLMHEKESDSRQHKRARVEKIRQDVQGQGANETSVLGEMTCPLDEALEEDLDDLPPSEAGYTPRDDLRATDVPEEELEIDDIKTEYHPSSGRAPIINHFQDFKRVRDALEVAPEEHPFRPFRCRADFEFARVSMQAALKPEQINMLIKIIKDVAGGARFTISGDRDLSKTWEKASDILTPFKSEEIEVPYLKQLRKYTVWFRPLWDWTLDLLSDKRLLPHFTWTAERLYKYDGECFVRFIDEPWTANRFWEIQSKLPIGSYPFCWILYADRSKLSSFGTVKGHPVIVRCANLPTEIRNGTDLGGGRIIGWLPIISEESAHAGKPTFTNHKHTVWHKAIELMIGSLKKYAEIGYSFVGADGVARKIHPCILILSADYEEQCFMASNRGVGCYCPCPVCLISWDDQADLSVTAKLRTVKSTVKILERAKKKNQADAEKSFKAKGLRNVENVFYKLRFSDPFKAVSWDRLHSYSLGIFGDHMWFDFKVALRHIGRKALEKVDDQMSQMPRFKNLHHFKEVTNISFNDGSKFEALSKQFMFAAHNVLTARKSKHGYLLLQCLKSFLILDTILSFEVQTEDTLKLGENELQSFSVKIAAYAEAVEPLRDKKRKYTVKWDFIKMHYQQHAFAHILAKGVTRNYNTKPNENLHRQLRDAYHQRTNFKNVEKQILKIDHYLLVCSFIQSKLDKLDNSKLENSENDEDKQDKNEATELGSRQFCLGAIQPKCVISVFEQLHNDDVAFRRFRSKLAAHLTEFLTAHSIALPRGRPLRVSENDTITEYHFVKINYENLVTWRESTDYLRCNPTFHGNPRYDSVIVRTVKGEIFAKLICLFNVVIDGTDYPTALIQPCDVPIRRLFKKDVDLGLNRVRAKPRNESEFVSVKTIVRGAVLVPDFGKEGDFLVMDVLDADMFVRIRKMQNFW